MDVSDVGSSGRTCPPGGTNSGQRGITLAELVCVALDRAIETPAVSRPGGRRVEFLLVRSGSPESLKITNAVIAEMEAEEDARRGGYAL